MTSFCVNLKIVQNVTLIHSNAFEMDRLIQFQSVEENLWPKLDESHHFQPIFGRSKRLFSRFSNHARKILPYDLFPHAKLDKKF